MELILVMFLEDEVELKGRLKGDLIEDMTLPVQEIEDNYEHFDYDDFVPTAYVLPRRRRVAVRGEHATSSSSSIHDRTSGSDLSCTIDCALSRLYGIYAFGSAISWNLSLSTAAWRPDRRIRVSGNAGKAKNVSRRTPI